MSTPAHNRATRQHGGRAIVKPREMDPASRLGAGNFPVDLLPNESLK